MIGPLRVPAPIPNKTLLKNISIIMNEKKDRIAWCLDADRKVSIAYPGYQGPPLLSGEHFVDISVSPEGYVFLLEVTGGVSRVHYTPSSFPPNWQVVQLDMGEGIHGRRLDAGPGNVLYLACSNGALAEVKIDPEHPHELRAVTFVPDVENVQQVCTGSDGTIWVIAHDATQGTVAKQYDGKKWKDIPEVTNTTKIAGTNEGDVYLVNAEGKICLVNKAGKTKELATDFVPDQISVDPEGRLWCTVRDDAGPSGNSICWTDDEGVHWTTVQGSRAILLDAGIL